MPVVSIRRAVTPPIETEYLYMANIDTIMTLKCKNTFLFFLFSLFFLLSLLQLLTQIQWMQMERNAKLQIP